MSRLKSKYSNLLKDQTPFSSSEEEEEEEEVDIDDQYDSGVIRCICDDPSDDGFTIQCEHCLDWQHASCVNVKRNKIPKHYLCNRCSRLIKKKRPAVEQHQKELKVERKKKREEEEEEEEMVDNATMNQKGYVHTSRCIIRQRAVANIFKEVRQYWFQLNKLKTPVTLDAAIVKGLESLMIMESNLLIPSIPKVSVKPIKRSMRGSYNEKIPLKGVFADIHIPEDRYLMEVTGEIKLKSEYKSNNHFSLLGTPLRHIFFYRSLDACIDAREFGNEARFIRRSCQPNSEIKSIILPNDNDDIIIHMGIYTTEELDKGEEVTIGWNWQRGLLIHQKYQEFLKKNTNDEPKRKPESTEVRNTLRRVIKLLETQYGECGCEDKEECFIEYIKEEIESESEPKPKRKRPGRPRLSESKPLIASSSDDEQKLSTKKRILSSEPLVVASKRIFTNYRSKLDSSTTETLEYKVNAIQARELHGKKRWLQLYLSEQREKEKMTTAEPRPMDTTNDYSSDASSESTLPLNDDTREIAASSSSIANNQIELKSECKIEMEKEKVVEKEKELIKDSVEDSNITTENKPATTRVKLSIQEYLSMRRNLPTN
ncbi:hypothetical protein G6F61_007248 [Rhizopus arrhizus]|nr:hypothetical protein G6F61_007248 [Rhizopus arrhizus]